jgi:hypothetical protein
MAEERIENDVPSRDEASSPTDSVKDDGPNFRLLIVANRLPITIKKQSGVISLKQFNVLTGRVDTNIKSPKEAWLPHWLD